MFFWYYIINLIISVKTTNQVIITINEKRNELKTAKKEEDKENKF